MPTLTETIRATVLDVIGHVKVEELRDPAVLALLGDVRLRDLVTPAPRALARRVDVRTKADKSAYDAAVLSAIRSRGRTALAIDDIASTVGGDVPQVRAALHRLIGAKKVKRLGKTRATRYAAARRA